MMRRLLQRPPDRQYLSNEAISSKPPRKLQTVTIDRKGSIAVILAEKPRRLFPGAYQPARDLSGRRLDLCRFVCPHRAHPCNLDDLSKDDQETLSSRFTSDGQRVLHKAMVSVMRVSLTLPIHISDFETTKLLCPTAHPPSRVKCQSSVLLPISARKRMQVPGSSL